MSASQGVPIRHAYMQLLIKHLCHELGNKPINILEIGSWAGGSAITWANAIDKYNQRNGIVVCIDPWQMYLDDSGFSEFSDAQKNVYREMIEALHTDDVFHLFLHNNGKLYAFGK